MNEICDLCAMQECVPDSYKVRCGAADYEIDGNVIFKTGCNCIYDYDLKILFKQKTKGRIDINNYLRRD